MKMFRALTLFLLAPAVAAFAPLPLTAGGVRSTALNVAIDTSDIKNGLTVEIDGEPYKVLNFSIMKQARGAAKTTIKFKNLMRGSTIENTYRSGEKFETAMIEKKAAQFTYAEGVSTNNNILLCGGVIRQSTKTCRLGSVFTLGIYLESAGLCGSHSLPLSFITEHFFLYGHGDF